MKKTICSAVLMLTAVSACGTRMESAENLYRDYCAGCHGADRARDFGNREWQHGETNEDLAKVIHDGLPKSGMPAFGSVLSDENIRSLVSFVRQRPDAVEGSSSGGSSRRLGATIEAESLNPDRSINYTTMTSEADPEQHYLGHLNIGSYLCYDDVDLTGVRSIDIEYAKGPSDPRRLAVVIQSSANPNERTNVGERVTTPTGGWETFRRLNVGLARQVRGQHQLCFLAMDGGGVNLDKFTLSPQPGENDGVTQAFAMPETVQSAAGHEFVLERVAESPGELWAMDFLPEGTIVASQKDGRLWLFKAGERTGPIEGIPEVWTQGQAGLLQVKAHPQYETNGWLYLTFAELLGNGAMTRVVRGQIDELKWVNEQTIYRAPEQFYTEANYHFGSRLVFQGDHVYFSVGDRGQQTLAQDLSRPNGKIHRLFADGRIPEDNPFVARENALASIFSYGHRNPQGLTVHPLTGEIWSAEHGPRGGDELNVVREARNYGWPVVTFGVNYDGTRISDLTQKDGMESPRHHWTPSIAVSQIDFYTGRQFPRWRNQLLVGSLGKQELRLVRIHDGKVVGDELLLQGLGRIRDVRDGPDGYPYVVFNNPNGAIFRLVPARRASMSDGEHNSLH